LEKTLEICIYGFSKRIHKLKLVQTTRKETLVYFSSRLFHYPFVDFFEQDTQDRLNAEEEARNQLSQQKRKLEQEMNGLRKELEDLELSVSKSEGDKNTKEHQIRCLNDEIAHQDELINKLNKEKKHMQEVNQKSAEDMQVSIEKLPMQINLVFYSHQSHLT